MYHDRLTKYWYISKYAIRYEGQREDVAYASREMAIEMAGEVLKLGIRNIAAPLWVEAIPLRNYLKRRLKRWSYLPLSYIDELKVGDRRVRLNRDLMLMPGHFFEEQGVDRPVEEVMIRIPVYQLLETHARRMDDRC